MCWNHFFLLSREMVQGLRAVFVVHGCQHKMRALYPGSSVTHLLCFLGVGRCHFQRLRRGGFIGEAVFGEGARAPMRRRASLRFLAVSLRSVQSMSLVRSRVILHIARLSWHPDRLRSNQFRNVYSPSASHRSFASFCLDNK